MSGYPPYLYHGTANLEVDTILEEGLRPRSETNVSNWDTRGVPSIGSHVYLTQWFASFFALNATDGAEYTYALYEVDAEELNTQSLYPDEDYIEQSISANNIETPDWYPVDGDMTEQTKAVRDHIDEFHHFWVSSVEELGSISHKGTIPPEAISRVSIVELKSDLARMIDPSISIQTVQFLAEEYGTLNAVLFNDASVDDYMEASLPEGVDEGPAQAIRQWVEDSEWTVFKNPDYAGDN